MKPAASENPIDPETPTASTSVVIISRRAAERLRRGHPWVYASEIEQRISDAPEIPFGALVTVAESPRRLLGTAIYSSTSQIALRMIAPDIVATRDEFLDLLRTRLRAAIRMRIEALRHLPHTDACRLVFGEADELPGIVLDRYSDLFILQLLAQGTAFDDVRKVVVETVCEMLVPETVVERPDARIRELEQLPAPPIAPIYARDPGLPQLACTFQMNGLKFHFDANAGQKTGAFLDQRENYVAAANHAHGRALDVCTYQGGFALHLARACTRVTGVDASRAALEVADRNLRQNREVLLDQGGGVEWIEANAFDLLRDWSDSGEEFDTIVLDPPAFAKSKRTAEGALRGYKELNLRALKMLRPGGTLITCSCSHHVALSEFQAVVAAAASDAHRRVRLLEIRGAAFDHPAILTIPETHYLKCLICVTE